MKPGDKRYDVDGWVIREGVVVEVPGFGLGVDWGKSGQKSINFNKGLSKEEAEQKLQNKRQLAEKQRQEKQQLAEKWQAKKQRAPQTRHNRHNEEFDAEAGRDVSRELQYIRSGAEKRNYGG